MTAGDDKQRENNFCLHTNTCHNLIHMMITGNNELLRIVTYKYQLHLRHGETSKSTLRENVLDWTRFGVSGFAPDFEKSPSFSESQVSHL